MAKRVTKKKVAKKKVTKKAAGKKPIEGKIFPALKITALAAKYTGHEPEYDRDTFDEAQRKTLKLRDFGWYNYHYSYKDVTSFVGEWLKWQQREDDHKVIRKVPLNVIPNGIAWLCRMSMRGWPLSEGEQKQIDTAIADGIAAIAQPTKKELDDEADAAKKKSNAPTIQDRMREKAAEAGGELEGLLDEYIAEGCPAKHNFQPIGVLKLANILPQHVPDMVAHWEKVRDEFKEVQAGKDEQLKEGYGRFSKIQIRYLIRFAEMMIEQLGSYVTFKKANRAPRKRKPKTPEQLTRNLKYKKDFSELGLTSVKPTKIIGAKEMFVYNTKHRKLQYYVADEYAGGELTVKNNTIVGFDPNKSVQKGLRKPKEQLKAFMTASRPKSRKLFADTKAVEHKMSGRFNAEWVILKVW